MDKVNEKLLELGMHLNYEINDSDFRKFKREFLIVQSKENLNESESKKVLLKMLSDKCFGFYISDITKHYKFLGAELRKEVQMVIEDLSVQFNGTEFETEIDNVAYDPEYVLVHCQNAIRRIEPSWEVRAIFMTRLQQQVEVMNVLKKEVHRIVEKANVLEHLSSALLAEM
ncbi:hypothetical protein [Bacillus sp. Brlt_9]|uniref:hypothetical protein n=1 Tax=Bacillus sp. Brlt_9 TaxID=3110916 RepID=UPI003F7B4E87